MQKTTKDWCSIFTYTDGKLFWKINPGGTVKEHEATVLNIMAKHMKEHNYEY